MPDLPLDEHCAQCGRPPNGEDVVVVPPKRAPAEPPRTRLWVHRRCEARWNRDARS
ncbi:MAG: hypothetical protein JJ863_14440 [Deltaproteobacteria bacterium]|nr:hypothetical protein [Deltaproteobacteria bacterium]